MNKAQGHEKLTTRGWARFGATGFSIGTKVYLGLGTSDGDILLKDFWEWDQATNVWTRKADYPGNSLIGAVGFSIGDKRLHRSRVVWLNSKDFGNMILQQISGPRKSSLPVLGVGKN